MIVLDFSKAFNKVSHNKLISSLHAMEFAMEFHPKKCNILRGSRSRCPSRPTYNYNLHDTTLKELEEVKYIAITITKDLSWEKHIHNSTRKANSQLGFIGRNVRDRSIKTSEKLYNTLVRPHLEYAASVWDPHVDKQKQEIEKVQRRAARWVTNQHDSMSSVTAMLIELDWQPLEPIILAGTETCPLPPLLTVPN